MLFINNDDVQKILTMEDTLRVLEDGPLELANHQEVSASGGVVGSDGKQGLQFVTVSSLVYDLAKQAGLGRKIPTEWFTQDIRD